MIKKLADCFNGKLQEYMYNCLIYSVTIDRNPYLNHYGLIVYGEQQGERKFLVSAMEDELQEQEKTYRRISVRKLFLDAYKRGRRLKECVNEYIDDENLLITNPERIMDSDILQVELGLFIAELNRKGVKTVIFTSFVKDKDLDILKLINHPQCAHINEISEKKKFKIMCLIEKASGLFIPGKVKRVWAHKKGIVEILDIYDRMIRATVKSRSNGKIYVSRNILKVIFGKDYSKNRFREIEER